MKIIQWFESRRLRVSVRLVFAALLAAVVGSSAQTDAGAENGKSAKLAKDPFVKGEKADPGAKAKTGVESRSYQQVAHVSEFIETSHDDFRNWLKANPGTPDGDALRAEVQKWIEKGSAQVVASQMLMARSGQRAKVESIRELIYPTEFQAIDWSPSTPHPKAFETRNLGMTLEIDPVIESANTIYLSSSPEWIELAGESKLRQEPEGSVQPGDVRLPMIRSNRVATQMKQGRGRWTLMDVEGVPTKNIDSNTTSLDPSRSVLVFSRSSIHESEAQVATVNDNAKNDVEQIYAIFEWVDIDQAVVTQWLQRDDFGQWIGGIHGARAAAEVLVDAGDAEIAYTRMIPCRSGQRAKSETNNEVIYPTEFEASKQHSLSTPMTLETRNTGITVEIDPVVGPGGTVIDMNANPEIVELVDHSVSKRYFDKESQEWKPDVTMPTFYTTKLTTQFTLIADQPLLVGIMMPHDGNGQPDKNKRRLLFVTVTH